MNFHLINPKPLIQFMQDNLIVIQFNSIEPPCFKEVGSRDWVLFGDDDNYIKANYLNWFNNSAKHNALIGGKVTYIYGNGLTSTDPRATMWMQKVNSAFETLNDVVVKSIFDNELYGGFYWQIIPLMGGGCEIYNLPYHKVRSNKDNTYFYYKEDGNFTRKREEIKPLPVYKIGSKNPGVYFYKSYRPGLDTYPLPGYIGATNYILADIEVGKSTYNNASGGFTASKFINFYNGEPDEKVKGDIERRFKKKFTGSAGDKIIIGFNTDPTKRPTIDDLGSSDLTKEDFTAVDNLIQQNIYAGHQITSPMLFGIKTEGQLGGDTELEVSYEIFKNTYANKKQQEFERVIKLFAGINNVQAPITFQPLTPVVQTITPAAPQQQGGENMTNDAVRNLTGRQHQQLMRIIRQFASGKLTQQQASTLIKTSLGLQDEEISSLLGVDDTFSKEYSEDEVLGMFADCGETRENFISLKSKSVHFSSDKEALEDELSITRETFKDITTLDAKILSLIEKDKRITPEVIAKTLKVNVDYVNKKLADYTERGLINSDTATIGQDEIIERQVTQPVSDIQPPESNFPDISIKYSYEWNPIVPSNERDTTAHPSRAFCKKLMALDRYYSRSDIEQISQRLGYSVWDRRGGFWNKGNGDISPTCRHIWRSNVLIKKQ